MRYVESDEQARAAQAGFSLKRQYAVYRDKAWLPLAAPMAIRRGDLVRVELIVSTPAARRQVVVDDPLPGGLEPVNPDSGDRQRAGRRGHRAARLGQPVSVLSPRTALRSGALVRR